MYRPWDSAVGAQKPQARTPATNVYSRGPSLYSTGAPGSLGVWPFGQPQDAMSFSYVPGFGDTSLDADPTFGRDPPQGKKHAQRQGKNRDEFDGLTQLLPKPSPATLAAQERPLPHLSTNLLTNEQDAFLARVNDRLSQCAFDFVAKYQFPIPIQVDKRQVEVPADREWTEWVWLLKRLATKRRIPARVLYNEQIKQFVTILENSLETRHAVAHQSRPLKDDRNVLQLISAGLQVAKILKDGSAMDDLNEIYVEAENLINERKDAPGPYF